MTEDEFINSAESPLGELAKVRELLAAESVSTDHYPDYTGGGVLPLDEARLRRDGMKEQSARQEYVERRVMARGLNNAAAGFATSAFDMGAHRRTMSVDTALRIAQSLTMTFKRSTSESVSSFDPDKFMAFVAQIDNYITSGAVTLPPTVNKNEPS